MVDSQPLAASLSTPLMKAAGVSETSEYFCQTTRRHFPNAVIFVVIPLAQVLSRVLTQLTQTDGDT